VRGILDEEIMDVMKIERRMDEIRKLED